MLFKPEHVRPILEGRKTQTRRLWKKPRVKVGAVHKCYTRPPFVKNPGLPFASVQILAVRREKLWRISPADARREGYATVNDFLDAWEWINGPAKFARLVWVVDFKLDAGD